MSDIVKGQEPPKPPAHLTVTIDGQPVELFMSFGLLNILTMHLSEVDQVVQIGMNYDLRTAMVNEVLVPRNGTGRVLKEGEPGYVVRNLDDSNISIEDVEAIIDWASDHILNFFVRQQEKTLERMLLHKPTIDRLQASANGTAPSASTKPSA